MMLKNLSLYGSLLLLCQMMFSCSGPDDAREATVAAAQKQDLGSEASEPTRQIVAFGDSLYAGYGLGPKEGLAPMLQSALRDKGYAVTVRDAGVSGDTTAAGLARLNFVLDSIDEDIELVLLGLGGNDMLRGIKPEETRKNLTAMMDELKIRDIDVMLTGMIAAPNLGADYGNDFNSIYPQLAKKYEAALYPFILDGVITDGALMLPDNVHPNAKGVAKITSKLLPIIEQELEADE